MVKVVSEVTQGVSYTFDGTSGQNPVQTTRVFKIIKDTPAEYINLQAICGVFVGDGHPSEPDLFCSSLSAQYDGESRMLIIATFNYSHLLSLEGGAGGGQPPQPPPLRPSNWSITTNLIEVPAFSWRLDGQSNWGPIVNPVGDLYEGVVRNEAIVQINVTQFEEIDPTRNCLYAGMINANTLTVGSLVLPRHSVMFRGVQTTPAVETFGGRQYRGWSAVYEFAYRRNYVGSPVNKNIGWDVAQPVSGFNVKAFDPAAPDASDDVYGQPLKHENYQIVTPLALPDGIVAGEKVRACVRIFELEAGGKRQRTSALPVPLNDNGRPRKDTADPKVSVKVYQVNDDLDFNVLGLRIE